MLTSFALPVHLSGVRQLQTVRDELLDQPRDKEPRISCKRSRATTHKIGSLLALGISLAKQEELLGNDDAAIATKFGLPSFQAEGFLDGTALTLIGNHLLTPSFPEARQGRLVEHTRTLWLFTLKRLNALQVVFR